MKLFRLATTAAAYLLAIPAQAEEPSIRVDGVAALVGGAASTSDAAVILRSDVELMARIVLGGKGPEVLPSDSLPEALQKAVLNEIIGEYLIAQEAERVRITAPGPADLERERQRLENSAGGAERLYNLLRALSVPPSEIEKVARRRALVTAFLSANLEGTMVVTDLEVERTYQQAKGSLEGRTPEAAKELLRARLTRAALDRSIARWVSVLRARTPVYIIAGYAL